MGLTLVLLAIGGVLHLICNRLERKHPPVVYQNQHDPLGIMDPRPGPRSWLD